MLTFRTLGIHNKYVTKMIMILAVLFHYLYLQGQHLPDDNKKLLFIGQDLASVTDYRNNCSGCHQGHGEVSYLAFYTLEESSIFIDDSRSIYFGGMGMDNMGNRDTNNTDWGAGILNLWTASERSALVTIGLSIVEDAFFGADGLQKIVSGEHDSKILKMGTFFNAFPETIFYLRIGYEFDGNWNGYTQTKYINAYKHIVDLLEINLNQKNVDYVWQSCTSPIDDILDGGQENLENYYPGDSYVDWMGLSWFLKPNENPSEGNFIPATQLMLANELVAFAESRGKPVMIAESAPQGYNVTAKTNCNISAVYDGATAEDCISKTGTQIYEEWFDALFNFIAANDNVAALSYINANWDDQFLWSQANNGYASGYWGDTRVEADIDVMNNWIASISASENNFLQTEDPTEILNVLSTNEFIYPEDEFSIVPNPSSYIMNLNGVPDDFEYELFSVTGKKVGKGSGTIVYLGALPNGVYILKSTHLIKRLVKK